MFLSVLIHKFCIIHCCFRQDVLKRALLGLQTLHLWCGRRLNSSLSAGVFALGTCFLLISFCIWT